MGVTINMHSGGTIYVLAACLNENDHKVEKAQKP
jgi:hypothetical protein